MVRRSHAFDALIGECHDNTVSCIYHSQLWKTRDHGLDNKWYVMQDLLIPFDVNECNRKTKNKMSGHKIVPKVCGISPEENT